MKAIQTAGKTIILRKDNCPTKCASWNANANEEDKFNFTCLKELWDESHDQFRLYRCETCETYYLWHWHEEIGWDGGGDSVSICCRSLGEADLVVIKYFEEHAPNHSGYGDFLKARILNFQG